MVDFMCVGAPKCGTTWLYKMLNQHPNIFIPPQKELHYFNTNHPETKALNPNNIKGLDWYDNHFKKAGKNQLRGDFSTSYLNDPSIAQRLYNYNPNLKIIIILRNPVDRAWSHFGFLYSRGMLNTNNFFTAIERHQSILDAGKYADHVQKFLDTFPMDQIVILSYLSLNEPNKLIQSLFNFLQVSAYTPQGIHAKINESKKVRNVHLHKFLIYIKHGPLYELLRFLRIDGALNFLIGANLTGTKSNEIPANIHQYLTSYYQDDIQFFRNVLNKRNQEPLEW